MDVNNKWIWIGLAILFIIVALYHYKYQKSGFDPYLNTIQDDTTTYDKPKRKQNAYDEEYGPLVDWLQSAIDWSTVMDYSATNPFPHMVDLVKAIVTDEVKITGQVFNSYESKVAAYTNTSAWCSTYGIDLSLIISGLITMRNLTPTAWLSYSPDVSGAAAVLNGTVVTSLKYSDTTNTIRATEWARMRNYDVPTMLKAIQADQTQGGTANILAWCKANNCDSEHILAILASPNSRVNSIEDALEATLPADAVDAQVRYARDNFASIPWRPEVEIETITPAVQQIGISRVKQVQYPQNAGAFTNDYVRPQLTQELLSWNGNPM